ncbi:MAG: hypothetical protein K2X91_06255, partial [Thermoleophilia bacterium]|nr:hypothetical protein [Thermoleophilia bacterium]
MVEERLRRRVAALEPIAAGMGTRRFFRVHFAEGMPRTIVARCDGDGSAAATGLSGAKEPAASARRTAVPPFAGVPELRQPALPPAPAWLPEPPLEPLRTFLAEAGLPVPRSHGHFPELGLEL